MNATHSRSRFGVISLVILLLALAAGGGLQLKASAQAIPAPPFTNPGFEDGDAGWTFAGPDAAVVVTGSEGPGQFSAYASTPDGAITVNPHTGNRMARLGTPKDVNSSQTSGINTVSQTFRPSQDTLSFAARLFSWENRRETDRVEFAVRKADGTAAGSFPAFSFRTKAGVTAASCPAGPSICSSSIDAGNRNDYLSSLGSTSTGWVVITVTGLPTDQDVTFTASVGSTANSALASWLYLDAANTPPIAAFDFTYPRVSLSGGVPGIIDESTGVGPLEGSPIQFQDFSTDPDPSDQIVAWEWTVTKNGAPVLNDVLTVQNPFFVPHDDGQYVVTLKVTDSSGDTDTEQRTISVLNAPPLVNALNVEAIAGKPFPVTGRFTDAGWEDTHTASWSGLPVNGATLVEDHAPALGTGLATATSVVAAPGTTNAGFAVSDGVSAKTDPFVVTSLSDTSSLLGYTEFDGARAVTIDGSYLGLVPEPGTRSVYEIQWPGSSGAPQPLPGGAEILVNLKDLPADYDLVLVTVPPAGTSSTGYAFSGFAFSGYAFSDLPNLVSPYAAGYAFSATGVAGYAFSGIQRAAYGEAGYAFSDLDTAGYAFSGYAFSGYAFSGYAFSDFGGFGGDAFAPYAVAGYAFSPISQMGFTGLQQSNTSPADVALSELGLGSIPPGTSVVGYSANRGLDRETVLARIDEPGTRLYAIVVGANGAFSPEPFRVDVEGSMTITAAALNADPSAPGRVVLSGATCAPRFTGDEALAPFSGASLVRSQATPTTLFVTQQERLQGLHPGDAGYWDSFVSDMHALAARPEVRGKIISINAAAEYAAWDATPCSIDAANAVSDAVRNAVQAELTANPTIEYVVILGDDDVIPFRRVPDQVSIGNERSYLSSSFLKQGTPLYASVAGGFNLTDDCNVDAAPTAWQGREFCIPDTVVARMVETPVEIAAQARAFIASEGHLNQQTASNRALVSGYDFFSDGSEAVALELEKFIGVISVVTRLIREDWTADDLRCELLGIGDGCLPPPAIADANAHFTHYAGLSANGFNTGEYTDVLTSTDVAIASALDSLVGKLVYSIGCHAGFSAPDRAVVDVDPNLGIDARLDFAQAFAQARAVYIASTGYGIGDDSGIAGTERLIVLYAEELAKGKTAGEALKDAKRYYLSALPAASVYDEKSSIGLTFYGLPMYGYAAGPVAPQLAESQQAPLEDTQTVLFPVHLETVPGTGNYFAADQGDAAAPPYRPLQPRQVIPVGDAGLPPVHGILWTSGGFTDYENFDPVISRPTVEWELNPTEPQVCYQGFWPSEIFRVNTLDGANGLEQTIVVTPGQFRCDGLVGGQVRGTQRIFDILSWEMLRSDSFDVTPPSLVTLDMDYDGAGGLVFAVDALDPTVDGVETSGVARIVILRIDASTGEVTSIADQAFTPVASGTFLVPIPNPGNDRLIIQIVDAAGNVGVYSAKGPGLRVLAVDLGPDKWFSDNQPVTFSAAVDQAVEPMVSPVSYFWDFGDGTTVTTATSTVAHTFNSSNGTEYEVKVRVTDSNGGIGIDRVMVRSYCFDAAGDANASIDSSIIAGQADLIGCVVSHSQSTGKMTISLKTAAALDSPGPYPAKIRYTVNVGVGNGPSKSLSFREGSSNGVKSLVVTISGNTISFTFDQKDVGWSPGKVLTWYAETRAGVEGTSGAGMVDRMPDAGNFTYGP